MPGNYVLRRTYVDGDILSASDYMADHQNHIDNQTPDGTDDYSLNVSQMRTITDTGDDNGESLATSLSGEIARIRFVLKHIKDTLSGSTVLQWYSKSYSVVIPNGTVTTVKLANGATFVQFIRATALDVAINDAAEHIIISQGITITRTRVRVKFCFSGIDFRSSSPGGTDYTIRIKRGATVIATVVHPSISTASVQNTVTFYEEVLDTTTVGNKTYSATIQLSNTNTLNISNQSWLIVEEVA